MQYDWKLARRRLCSTARKVTGDLTEVQCQPTAGCNVYITNWVYD